MTSQEKALRFIRKYIREVGVSPTYRDIASEAGVSFQRAASIVEELVEDGFLKRVPGSRRGIALTEKGRGGTGKFRIVSDGTGIGTRLYAPNGEEVTAGVFSIEFKIGSPSSMGEAVVTVFAEADVEVLYEHILAQVLVNDKVE